MPFWYPDEKFVIKTHEEILNRFGGHAGFDRRIESYALFVREVKQTRETYRKAAILLERLIQARIFCDRNHRTAFEIARLFLEKNGKVLKVKDPTDMRRFVLDIRSCNVDEIQTWLKEGKIHGI